MTYCELLINQRILHVAISAGIIFLVYCTLDPILSLRLEDYSSLSEAEEGLVFAVMPISYTLGTFLYPYIIPKRVPYRVTIITGLGLLSGSQFFVGPFFTEKSLVSMVLALAVSGFV